MKITGIRKTAARANICQKRSRHLKKRYDEEYEFAAEVTGLLHGGRTENYCRNGEGTGDRYTCTYGCPVNRGGFGICPKTMMMLYPLMEAVRSGGDSKYSKKGRLPGRLRDLPPDRKAARQ